MAFIADAVSEAGALTGAMSSAMQAFTIDQVYMSMVSAVSEIAKTGASDVEKAASKS